ncbi:hypothetical protein C7999DRAFT_43878 [Corynascus novoguineensis]|uniref:Uncharacterized protein n=1 Tax=Corynascus novoguineensis TaxID=1126955 RepID=A0AAN7HJL2_9PEZI|nr:hypothetical protein C7999DRAFT_43878 [Corynascus novoguineensis]
MTKACDSESWLEGRSENTGSPSTESAPHSVNADDYARRNRLTIDSLLSDWQRLVDHDLAIKSSLPDFAAGQLIEATDTQLQESLFRAIIPTTEQWQLPISSLQLLQHVCGRLSEAEAAVLISEQNFSGRPKWANFKLETTLLRSDHNTDCRRLARRIKSFRQVPLPDHFLPLHPTNASRGEGIGFPEEFVSSDKKKVKAIEEEKLEVTRETLLYLMQGLKSDLTNIELQAFVGEVSTYQGIEVREHLTPLLSPLSATYPAHFVPENEFCEISYSSDPSSRVSEDIEDAEKIFFKTDFEFWSGVLEKDGMPERYDNLDISEMIRAGELRSPTAQISSKSIARDLSFKLPLLSFSDGHHDDPQDMGVLSSADLKHAKEKMATGDTLSGSNDPTDQLVALFQTSATTVTRATEQERLQPLDATDRVTVPVLDFSISVPEWEKRLWEAKKIFQWIQKENGIDFFSLRWLHNKRGEQRMVWVPLPHMREKRLISKEQLEIDTTSLEYFLRRVHGDEILTSADYIYKEPGLAVLRTQDDDDDEGYLTPIQLSAQQPPNRFEPTNLVMTVPSRQIEEAFHKRLASTEQTQPLAASPAASATDIISPTFIPSTNILRGFMSEYTDFAPLVDNFLEMNFSKKPKLTHSRYFVQPGTAKSTSQFKADEAAMLMAPPPKPVPALVPSINLPRIFPRIAVSFRTSHTLIQQLKRLIPAIELIHRNHDKYRTHRYIQGVASPNLDEADIVVSPITGIHLTTMVQLRQRVIPGVQPRATNFCRVLENVAMRHERVVVLVSEGNKYNETASPLSQSDARALAEVQGFAAASSATTAHVQLMYVGGGMETLAKWIAAVVCEYYPKEAEGVRDLLLPVETFWEVFLRRAGMNVFAAQVVLGKLKMPDGSPAIGGEDGQVFGLPLFLTMPKKQRVEMSAEAFGGRRVLDRVSDFIDKPWDTRTAEQAMINGEMTSRWVTN